MLPPLNFEIGAVSCKNPLNHPHFCGVTYRERTQSYFFLATNKNKQKYKEVNVPVVRLSCGPYGVDLGKKMTKEKAPVSIS